MKVSKWAIILAMASGLSAATAFGQSGLRQPGQVAPAGFEYGSYDYYAAQEPAPSPSDAPAPPPAPADGADRKSTRLNSSHGYISYAVFCLKKKRYPIQTRIPLDTM